MFNKEMFPDRNKEQCQIVMVTTIYTFTTIT